MGFLKDLSLFFYQNIIYTVPKNLKWSYIYCKKIKMKYT